MSRTQEFVAQPLPSMVELQKLNNNIQTLIQIQSQMLATIHCFLGLDPETLKPLLKAAGVQELYPDHEQGE